MPDERPPDLFNLVARKKLGQPDTWRWHTIESVDRSFHSTNRDAIVSGGIPYAFVTRGPNKGHPKWRGESQRCVVTEAEREAELVAWEREAHRCGLCNGKGERQVSFHADPAIVPTFRTCDRCAGCGKPPLEIAHV